MTLTVKDILVMFIVFSICEMLAKYIHAFIEAWRKDRARARANRSTLCNMKHPRRNTTCDVSAGHMGEHQGIDRWDNSRVFWPLNEGR